LLSGRNKSNKTCDSETEAAVLTDLERFFINSKTTPMMLKRCREFHDSLRFKKKNIKAPCSMMKISEINKRSQNTNCERKDRLFT